MCLGFTLIYLIIFLWWLLDGCLNGLIFFFLLKENAAICTCCTCSFPNHVRISMEWIPRSKMLDWRRYRLERHCQNAFQILYQFIAPAMVFKSVCFYTMLRISYLSSLLNFCQYYKINFWFTFPWSSHLILTIVFWSMYYHFPQLANLETRFREAFFLFLNCAGSSLLCGLFSSCDNQGLLFRCGAWASDCRWLLLLWSTVPRACRLRWLGHMDSCAWWASLMGSHRVGHDWSDLAVAAAVLKDCGNYHPKCTCNRCIILNIIFGSCS